MTYSIQVSCCRQPSCIHTIMVWTLCDRGGGAVELTDVALTDTRVTGVTKRQRRDGVVLHLNGVGQWAEVDDISWRSLTRQDEDPGCRPEMFEM